MVIGVVLFVYLYFFVVVSCVGDFKYNVQNDDPTNKNNKIYIPSQKLNAYREEKMKHF